VASTSDLPPSDPWSAPPASSTGPHSAGPPEPYTGAAGSSGGTGPGAVPPDPYTGAPFGATTAGAVPPDLAPLPVPVSGFGGPGPVIVQVGDIGVTSTVVHTPAGDIPLAGSAWQVSDYWYNEQKIPTWAIVCAIVGFCVLTVFSLLFLLVKVTVPRGTVQVTVTNGPRQYVSRIPVTDQGQVTYINQQVNYIRSLAAL
jgi:hypothetical protein